MVNELLTKLREETTDTPFQPAAPEEVAQRQAKYPPDLYIYKGDRDHPGDYDNFTYNKKYKGRQTGWHGDMYLLVTNDKGQEVRMPSIDFDYVDEAKSPFQAAGKGEIVKRQKEAGLVTCADCGREMYPDDNDDESIIEQCPRCGKTLCMDCYWLCDGCEEGAFCKSCMYKKSLEWDNHYCKDCGPKVDVQEAREGLIQGELVTREDTEFDPKPMFGLNPGEAVSQIGVLAKSGKQTSASRVFSPIHPIIYRGIYHSDKDNEDYMGFEYKVESGETLYKMFKFDEEAKELYLVNERTQSILIYKAQFVRVPVAEAKSPFQPASKKEVAKRHETLTWEDRILDMQPDNAESSVAMWFEELAIDVSERNQEFESFVASMKKYHNVDLTDLLKKYIQVPEGDRNENTFCDAAAERIARAGLWIYNSDNFFEVYDSLTPEDLVEAETPFKPASDEELIARQGAAAAALNKKLRAKGVKVEYLVAPEANRMNSFWYEGDVARITYTAKDGEKRELTLTAQGEISVMFVGDDTSYRNYGAVEEALRRGFTDENLAERFSGVGDERGQVERWDNNNWFEFWFGSDRWEGQPDISIMDGGDTLSSYDEGLEYAADLITDDEAWHDTTDRFVEK